MEKNRTFDTVAFTLIFVLFGTFLFFPLLSKGNITGMASLESADPGYQEVMSDTVGSPMIFGLLFALLCSVIVAVIVEVGSFGKQESNFDNLAFQEKHFPVIEEYIQDNVKKGFSFDELENSLVDSGWDHGLVQRISQGIKVKHKKAKSFLSSQEVAMFVEQSLNSGYSKEQVSSILMQQDCPIGTAREIVQNVTQSMSARNFSFPKKRSSRRYFSDF